jgi:CheY-like chemotaxis protein
MKADKRRVLVVDDEVSITRLLKLNLEKTGRYQVCEVNSSGLALKIALEFQPDLILLDVIMPGMDGGYLASTLRSHPALKSVPIVFLTAAATKEEVATRTGIIGGLPFLAKPVDLSEVLGCLDTQLRGTPGARATAV